MSDNKIVAIKESLAKGNTAEAQSLLNTELKESPTAEIYYLASQVAVNENQRRAFLEKAVEMDPFHEKAVAELEELDFTGHSPQNPASFSSSLMETDTTNNNEATLVVERKFTQFMASAAKLGLKVNGKQVGEVSNGKTERFHIPAGQHEIMGEYYAAIPILRNNRNQSEVTTVTMLPGDIAHFYSEPSTNSAQRLSLIGLERKESQLAKLSQRQLERIKEDEEQYKREAKQSLELAQGMSGLSSDTLGGVMTFSFVFGVLTFFVAGPFCLAPILLGLLIGVPVAYAAKSSEKELAIKQAQKKLNLAEREILKVEKQLRNAGQSKSAAPISFEIREASVAEESQSLSDNLEAELRKAKRMLDQGLITEEEFQLIRKRLIDKFK